MFRSKARAAWISVSTLVLAAIIASIVALSGGGSGSAHRGAGNAAPAPSSQAIPAQTTPAPAPAEQAAPARTEPPPPAVVAGKPQAGTPQGNGGDSDPDNNGGADDGDGAI